MKSKYSLIALLASLAIGLSHAQQTVIIDDSLGLSPGSVFDVATPQVFEYPVVDPKNSGVLSRFWDGAPPQVPHRIDKFIPVNAKLNKCLECHEEPEKIGKKVKGKPTPMSQSHYDKSDDELVASHRRYFCTACHVPQADVNALVENTYRRE